MVDRIRAMSLSPANLFRSITLIFALTFRALGGPAEPSDKDYGLRVWETDEGLPHNAVISVMQRKDGFLWVSTQGGLARFDGIEFQQVRSPLLRDVRAYFTRCVIEEDTKTLLIASDKTGLLRLSDGELTIHPLTPSFRPGRTILSLFREADDVFWIVFTNREAWRYDHGQIQKFAAPKKKGSLNWVSFAQDEKKKIYLARGIGVETYEGGKLSAIRGNALPSTVCSSQSGSIWMATTKQLCKLDKGKISVMAEPAPWSPDSPPSALLESRDGTLWIGTDAGGLMRWNAGPTSVMKTSHAQISDVKEDDEGNIWVATMGGGLD